MTGGSTAEPRAGGRARPGALVLGVLALLAPVLCLAWVALQAPARIQTRKASALAVHTTHPGSRAAARRSVPAATPLNRTVSDTGGMTQVTETVTVGLLHRSYVVFSPTHPRSARIPALVVLQGRGEPLWMEEARDGLLPLVSSGRALVVYPIGIGRSWNAGVCCGVAHLDGVNDMQFLTGVLASVGGARSVSSVFLTGFSNGGRMAYRLVCADPRAVSAFAVVDAVSSMGCPAGPPVSLLQVDGTRDGFVAYDSSQRPHVVGGFVDPTAVGQVAQWVQRDGCLGGGVTATAGLLRLHAWTRCAGGTDVQFATYEGERHFWPQGGPGTPSAATEVWSFFRDPGRPVLPVPVASPVVKATGGQPVPATLPRFVGASPRPA